MAHRARSVDGGGLNAYIPLLVVGVLGIGAVLLVCELVLDKVPVVDHLNDAVQTFIRPAVGGAVFTATAAAQQADGSRWLRDHPGSAGCSGLWSPGWSTPARSPPARWSTSPRWDLGRRW